ncbi:proline-rich basic protein 1 [Sphaerodactylus townsendi]|uniref:proline-rich basic protein 1 n=1 Tax=Sphaerodactylus townsendi TaxID=933632 RepID=UPI00202721DF|nr:proline-rich basic protein 1 [Sphaerodactylus townsendi]
MTGLNRERVEHELHPEDQILSLTGNSPSHKDKTGSSLPLFPARIHMGYSIKMFSCVARDGQISPEPGGLTEEHFNHYGCSHFSPEKDSHVSTHSKGDHTSETSGSSYRTALCSEEAESFKDCVEYFEEPGDHTEQRTYCDSEYKQDSVTATPILSAGQASPVDRNKVSKGTGSQLHGTLNSFGKALQDPGGDSEGEADTYVATSEGIHAHFAVNGSKAFGGSLAVQDMRPQSLQAGRNGAIKDQTCRDGLCPSDKESQQVQMSIKSKNSSDPVCSSSMGPVTRRLQPGDGGSKYLDCPTQFGSEKSKEMFPNVRKLKKNVLAGRAHGPVSSKAACPKYFGENLSVLSDSDEADNEVEKLTALSFQSLSCPQGSYLDMYSSSNRTSSSLSNSLPEDNIGMNRWPTCSDPRKTDLCASALGKEHFECVDVTLDNADGRRSLCKKRMVPKRQIQLRRKEKKDTGFCAAGDCAILQPFTQPRKESCIKGRTISDEFRLNYKQFMRAASLNSSYSKTRMASSLVKNVLAKKMQYEQRIKTEQGSVRGSSTSSVPSSVSTDLQGDSLEGKSSSLSKSDCSFSTEDVQSHSTSERSEPVAVNNKGICAVRPTKGVVLNEQLRENVCKLKKTFNELNERMKYQEASQLMRLPVLADDDVKLIESSNTRKPATGERKEYRRARAVFESMQDDTKTTGAIPKFAKTPKPWPNLKQRAIRQNKYTQAKEEKIPFKTKSLVAAKDTSRNTFTSKTKEMKLIPQVTNEQPNVLNAFKHLSLDRDSNTRRLPAAQSTKFSSLVFPTSGKICSDETLHLIEAPQMESRGKIRKHQPRDVRKLVNDTHNLGFKSSDSSSAEQLSYSESKSESSQGVLPKDSMSISPLFIHCTSVRRKEDTQAVNQLQEKRQDETRDVDASTLSLHDLGSSSTDHPHAPTQTPGNISTCHPENRWPTVSEPAVHITSIQSRKCVVENKELQPKVENKPVLCERTELNVRPSSAATKKESQLNIKVNSSVSKQTHKTETDHFPASSCSVLEERTTNEAFSPSILSSRENEAASSSEANVIPSSKCLQEIGKKDGGHVAVSHSHDPSKAQEPELSHQKHLPSENISAMPKDSKNSSGFLKDENAFSGLIHGSSRYPQSIRPPVMSTQNNQAQTAANSHFADSLFETGVLEDSRSWDNNNKMPPECDISDSPFPTREYADGIKPISNPPFTPSSSYGKFHDPGFDGLNKHQVTNEQYFSSAQADNTNYLTIPVRAHQSEAVAKHPSPAHPDNNSFMSSVSFQPSGEAPGNKASAEHFLPRQLERRVPSDNLLQGNLSHGQIPPQLDEAPNFSRRNERVSPSGKIPPSPTRHFAAPPQAHRKMLVDPESGKCYYVESPRQPQLKMLYDPETGQYIEVLIPPVPLSSHSGLYQPSFPPVVMNPGGYGPPYMSYPGFPGFPPPPPAMPPVQMDLQDQSPIQENTNEGFGHFPLTEMPPATQTTDGNYMESLYYIPTGMNSSPNASQTAFTQPASSGPPMAEKGTFPRM